MLINIFTKKRVINFIYGVWMILLLQSLFIQDRNQSVWFSLRASAFLLGWQWALLSYSLEGLWENMYRS